MRAYFLCNTWLSGIQKGIQGSHALAELVNHYGDGEGFKRIFSEWATDYKTMIFLEGGTQENLIQWGCFLDDQDSGQPDPEKPLHTQSYFMPYESFSEDEESLNGCTTAVIILVSTKLCNAIDNHRAPEEESESIHSWLRLSEWEREFVEKISKCRLAI
jgi:hypothetical protein